jgi:heptosyltransferase-2
MLRLAWYHRASGSGRNRPFNSLNFQVGSMSSGSTLIIKLGAMGDVLRTTSILRVLDGPVTWVTRQQSFPLLEKSPGISELLTLEQAPEVLRGRSFNFVACLDDELEACTLVDLVHWKERAGAYLQDGNIVYTDSAAPWNDMGLLSRFGKTRADELKRLNTRSFQEFLFAMFGKTFQGEEYLTGWDLRAAPRRRIGIEMRADARWRWKRWIQYPQLAERLQQDHCEVFFFEQRTDLRDFIEDVNSCGLVVTGDTLTMHIALALQKRVISVFGPTSAPEIFGYNRMTAVVSPIECIACYLKDCDKDPNCMDLITIDTMHQAVQQALDEIA